MSVHISDALRQLVQDEVVTAKQIAHAADRSVSTVYRWLSIEERTEPTAADICRLIRAFKGERPGDLLATALLAGSGYRAVRLTTDLDTNKDGETDLYDVDDDMLRAIDLWQQGSRALTNVRRDGEISDEIYMILQQTGRDLIHEMEKALATISDIKSRQPKRRKASG